MDIGYLFTYLTAYSLCVFVIPTIFGVIIFLFLRYMTAKRTSDLKKELGSVG